MVAGVATLNILERNGLAVRTGHRLSGATGHGASGEHRVISQRKKTSSRRVEPARVQAAASANADVFVAITPGKGNDGREPRPSHSTD